MHEREDQAALEENATYLSSEYGVTRVMVWRWPKCEGILAALDLVGWVSFGITRGRGSSPSKWVIWHDAAKRAEKKPRQHDGSSVRGA